MPVTTTRNWDKTWIVSHNGERAWKWTEPGHTVNFDEISADVWIDKMEARGFDVVDGRGKPCGNVWY